MKKTLYPYNTKERATARAILPLVALGGSLAATPAAALELGELTVQSNLGQPLRASIAYALAPNEMLSDSCVAIGGGRSTGGLPGIGKSTVSITDSAILISGQTVVREPMLGTRVTITCPYTPNLSREYMLFVDPATVAPVAAASAAAPVLAETTSTQPAARTTPRRARTAPVDATPIGQSSRYQVQAGESLGEIVARIENRSMSLWPAVNAVFLANPDAFIDNDPNKLKAGSWLTIPGFDGSAPMVAETAVPATASPSAAPDIAAGAVYEPPIIDDVAASVSNDPVVVVDPAAAEQAESEASASASVNDLRPGDVVPTSTVDIPDTALEGPATTSASPNVTTANIVTDSGNKSTSMLAWFVGGGVAILGLLVLFGRRIRNRFGSTPVGAVAATAATYEQDADIYEIEDDSPTEENLALDADLVLGTGLSQSTDMDIAQDFGFADTTELDIELPAEPEPGADETDVLPPVAARMDSILESEILPEDDDYDMSVIVDATKMPEHEEVTERDLQAVEVDPGDDNEVTDNYTISKEVDYDILEQDYEEELTATQALNLEIARATADLTETLDEAAADDVTTEMPLATVTEIDATAEMPVQENDDTIETVSEVDPGETAAVTVNMSADDKTAEISVANDDETAEMEISGGKSG